MIEQPEALRHWGNVVPQFASARVPTLKSLLSGEVRLSLPPFQRAYAWSIAECGRLLTNLAEFSNEATTGEGYALGTLLIAQKGTSSEASVIDGHQRLMTLTIMYAVLRDLAADRAQKAELGGRITLEDGRLVFSPQPSIAPLFRRLVQEAGATVKDFDDDLSELSETELKVLENRDYLRDRLRSEFEPAELTALARTLDERCWVFLHTVESPEHAQRMLRVEEDTRLRHNAVAQAKASLLGAMPKKDLPRCGKLWEECEGLLGAEDLKWLLHDIRTIALRKRNVPPLETALGQAFSLETKGLEFMENVLYPAAQRLAMLRDFSVGTGSARTFIRRHLEYLSWIEPHHWLAPALHWIDKRGESHRQSALFFERLDRLQWVMRIAGVDPNKQKDRMVDLLREIDKGLEVPAMKALELPPAMVKGMLANLNSRTFFDKRFSGEVLRRLSAELGAAPGPVDGKAVTIEHVLPHSEAKPGSQWARDFPSRKKVGDYAHRLGNLTLLTHHQNSHQAGTKDWAEKREVLANSGFVLSQEAAKRTTWTATDIDQRTEQLIGRLFAAWNIVRT